MKIVCISFLVGLADYFAPLFDKVDKKADEP